MLFAGAPGHTYKPVLIITFDNLFRMFDKICINIAKKIRASLANKIVKTFYDCVKC